MKCVESVGETVLYPEERTTPATLAINTKCECGCGKVVDNFCPKSLAIWKVF